MDISKLERNPEKVHEALMEVGDTLVAKKPVKIYVPEYYLGSELGSIDEGVSVVAIYAIVVDDRYYGVSKACALMQIDPRSSNVVTIGNEKYMEFGFDKSDKIIKNLNLVRTGTLVYRIYNEFIAKGNVPWYFDYSDLCFLFDTALLHGNANLRADSALLELIAASMARQYDDRTKFYRHDPRIQDLSFSKAPIYIPLNSVAFGATNTTAKILGNHFNEGLTSSLVTPSERVESIETLLRA